MPKVVKLKVEYEDGLQKIPATDVKIERGHLRIYDGDKLVADFPESKVEHWSFENE